MIKQLIIRETNKPFHYDLDKDMAHRRNGLFTFIIKVNNGNITDYSVLETDNYKSIQFAYEQQVAVSRAG